MKTISEVTALKLSRVESQIRERETHIKNAQLEISLLQTQRLTLLAKAGVDAETEAVVIDEGVVTPQGVALAYCGVYRKGTLEPIEDAPAEAVQG